MQKKSKYSVAIFAYNIGGKIEACLKSILLNSLNEVCDLYVMANGCTDDTESVVQNLQKTYTNIHLVSLSVADKANAWNHYVHKLAPAADVHFFIDGDVEIEVNALSAIANTMYLYPTVNAVGGVPTVGRDKTSWTDRMITFGRVSGGLYALRDSFLKLFRKDSVKLPIGFIGDDFLVSALAKSMLNFQSFYKPSPLLKIERQAGFSFHPLSPMRVGDYLLFFRRLIRYRIRDYQMSTLIKAYSTHSMPDSVEQMYENSHLLPRYYWRGRYTIIDWLAVFTIRKRARKARQQNCTRSY